MKLKFSFLGVLIVIGVVGLLTGILLPGLARRTLFDPKPKLPPLEKNRIHHPKGFSIIAPEGWMSVVHTEPNVFYDSIFIAPKNRARFEPHIVAIQYENSDEASKSAEQEEYRKSEFLGLPAMVFKGRSARYHMWHAIFSKDDRWFAIMLMLPNGKDGIRYEAVPDYWWPFINSFRTD